MQHAVIPASVVTDAMRLYDIPGVAVGVVHGGEQEVTGFGVTSLENPLDVDGDTLFQIGSITKTYTATAALRLVEMQELALDEPVRRYLPDLRLADDSVARSVTMRHLLTHTGGWAGDYFASITPEDDALTQMVARLDGLEQLTPLGEVWAYNNAGFYIAGRAIESVAGVPFEAALHELVLDPLGLERSFFFPSDFLTYRFAVGHDRAGHVPRTWYLGRPAAPIGGLVASVRDLLTYARAQWSPGTLLSAASLEEMRGRHADIGRGKGEAFGLGWFLFERGERIFINHGGATSGQQARLVVAPEAEFALAVLTNHDDGAALARSLQAAVLDSIFGPAADVITPKYDVGSVSEYVGKYDSQLTAAYLTEEDGRLFLQESPKPGFPEPDAPAWPGPPRTLLAFEDRDRVIAVDPPLEGSRADFLRDSDGKIEWFRFGGRLHRPTFRRRGG